MTTTPLPPSYGIWTTDADGNRVMGFTPEQFLSVWQSRADLKAENARLREALSKLTHVLDFEDLLHDDQRKAYELAREALKETP